MDRRIHFLLSGEDKARYEARASREGLSLGAWLREAAEERYRSSREREAFRSAADLDAFFESCDERESSPEPDWEVQRRVLATSRTADLEPT